MHRQSETRTGNLGFFTIDRGAKYRIPGASATRERNRARNTGTNNYPTAPNGSNNVTSDCSTSVLIGDLSPWRHLTACSPCQEVDTTTIYRSLTLDKRYTEFPMCTSQKSTFSPCWPSGGSRLA